MLLSHQQHPGCICSMKKKKGRTLALITTAPHAFFSGCLKGPLCSLCSETKEEDRPGRERGSKGGLRGAFGHLPEMHFRQATQAADTQDPAGPLSLPQHRHCREAYCPHTPFKPDIHHTTDAQTHRAEKWTALHLSCASNMLYPNLLWKYACYVFLLPLRCIKLMVVE